jgi:hypothetical protein
MPLRLSAKQLKRLIPNQGSLFDAPKSKPSRHGAGKSSASESEIQAAILEYLERCSSVAFAHRQNTGQTKYVDRHGEQRWVRYGWIGCSDIIGFMTDGRFLAIECKSARGGASDDQVKFLQTVSAAGGVAILARSVDDVIDGIRAAKLPLNSCKHTA